MTNNTTAKRALAIVLLFGMLAAACTDPMGAAFVATGTVLMILIWAIGVIFDWMNERHR